MTGIDAAWEQLRGAVADLRKHRSALFELLLGLVREGGDDPAEPQMQSCREALWHALKRLDCLIDGIVEPPAREVDLSRDDEATRQLLYGLLVEDFFTPRLLDDPGEVFVPEHSPEEAALEVHFLHRRWLATWERLDAGDSSYRLSILLFEEAGERPGNPDYEVLL